MKFRKYLSVFCAVAILISCLAAIPSYAAGKSVDADKSDYTVGETISVTAIGDGKDYVMLTLASETASLGVGDTAKWENCIMWYYVADIGSGISVDLDVDQHEEIKQGNDSKKAYQAIPAGEYRLLLLENDGYNILDIADFTVKEDNESSEKKISTDKTVYYEGENIFATAIGEGKDWVIVALASETTESSVAWKNCIYWYYVAQDGHTSGAPVNIKQKGNASMSAYYDIPAGEYRLFLCQNDGYTVIDSVEFTVKGVDSDAPASASFVSNASFPGSAAGILTITSSATTPPSYTAYWGNANGRLEGYGPFNKITPTGETTEYSMVPNTIIPAGADRILVYASAGNSLSEKYATAVFPDGCGPANYGNLLYEMQVVSDTHIEANADHINNKHFSMMLEDIKNLSPNSLGILINGDVADMGLVSEYEQYLALIQAAGEGVPPIYAGIGNHDYYNSALGIEGSTDGTAENFMRYANQAVTLNDVPYFDIWLGGAHCIFMAPEAPNGAGNITDEQFAWLETALAEKRDPNRPIYVFMHQGILDTVAGTFEYQGWAGVRQKERLSEILSQYPEVILFSGHSHWTLQSENTMKARDEKLPTIFNTASTSYLWDDNGVGIVGSQGYYLYAYEDCLVFMGRDFARGEWIPSALFYVDMNIVDEPEVVVEGFQTRDGEKENTTDARFVATLRGDYRDLDGLGFEFTYGEKTVNVDCKYVYSSLIAGGETITPDMFEGDYFFCYTLRNIKEGDYTLDVRAYTQKKGSTERVYGDIVTKAFTVNADGSVTVKN